MKGFVARDPRHPFQGPEVSTTIRGIARAKRECESRFPLQGRRVSLSVLPFVLNFADEGIRCPRPLAPLSRAGKEGSLKSFGCRVSYRSLTTRTGRSQAIAFRKHSKKETGLTPISFFLNCRLAVSKSPSGLHDDPTSHRCT